MMIDQRSIRPIGLTSPNAAPQKSTSVQEDFSKALNQATLQSDAVKFSKHAMQRLESRGIQLTGDQQKRLKDSVGKAAGKGVRDALVVVDDLAFVVNVRNQTVITAMTKQDMQENIVTQIDGAVFS